MVGCGCSISLTGLPARIAPRVVFVLDARTLSRAAGRGHLCFGEGWETGSRPWGSSVAAQGVIQLKADHRWPCGHPAEKVLEKGRGIRGKLWMLPCRQGAAGRLLGAALGRLGTSQQRVQAPCLLKMTLFCVVFSCLFSKPHLPRTGALPWSRSMGELSLPSPATSLACASPCLPPHACYGSQRRGEE